MGVGDVVVSRDKREEMPILRENIGVILLVRA
jgi:hypothetical protein